MRLASLGAATFGYALNFNPRSMPILTGMSSGYLHPLVQNPRREFWRLTIIYACVTICVKLVFQLHVICVCDNMFSLAPNCPSEQNQQMCLQHYPELPYYHDEPMVTDWSLGLQKCFLSKVSGERGAEGNLTLTKLTRSAPAQEEVKNWVDMPFFPYRHEFYPVNTATQAKDGPNEVSDSTLESGGGGEFFGMIFWDAAVICVVLWHVNIMKLRGVWGKRKDNETQTRKRVEREEKKLTPEDKALLQVSGTPKIAICHY